MRWGGLMVTQVELQHLFTVLAELTRILRDLERDIAIEHQVAAHRYDTITMELNRKLPALEDMSRRILHEMRTETPTLPAKTTSWSLKDFIGNAWVRNIVYALALGISNYIVLGTIDITQVIKVAFNP